MPRVKLHTIDEDVWEDAFPKGEWARVTVSKEVEKLIFESKCEYNTYLVRMRTRKHYERLEVEAYLANIFKEQD